MTSEGRMNMKRVARELKERKEPHEPQLAHAERLRVYLIVCNPDAVLELIEENERLAERLAESCERYTRVLAKLEASGGANW